MADVNANIGVQIDTSDALAQLKSLQRQLSQFHTSVAKSSEAAALAQKSLQKNLVNSINSIGAFSAEMRTIKTTTESFTDSLEKNKFSMREYFRYAGGSTKSFGKLFKNEFDTIGKVAEERVKRLQTQYIKLGRDTNGAMKAIAVMPTSLDMNDHATKLQIAAQKQQIFNQLVTQGSTNLLNFGKNTQWAGRQLMVGFTIPLSVLGSTASKTFMEMEAQALKFKKVYGDLFTSQEETQTALTNVKELASMFTKYGIAASKTVGLAADAAAAGFKGIDLQRQTTQATRLSVLGQIEQQQALETTISLQNAFGTSSDDLAASIDFLNAVENQTVTSLDDITTAIPKVAPVIKQLGGNVKDLAFFLTAMKEGGVNASEGANALKSGLAALINPTSKATDMLSRMGIDIKGIVEKNQGDLKATVIGFAQALDTLAPLDRARAIEQMFGKFQFARLSTLFQNVTKDGTQASKVLTLAGASVQDLAALSEKELGMTADSAMNKFKKAVEDLKVSLVPVGETFLKAVTPIVEFFGGILDKFNNLSDNTKRIITILTVAIGGLGPVLLMTFGLLANGVANIIKLFLTLRNGYLRLTGQSQDLASQTQYLTMEQLDAAAAASSLDQAHAKLAQQFNVETQEVLKLIAAYQSAAVASERFAMANPGMMLPGKIGKKFASGGIVSGPGTGTSDSIIARVSNGEAIIPAKSVAKNPDAVKALVSGNIPGFAKGRPGSGPTGRIGKSEATVVRPYGANVSSTGGLVNFTDIDPGNIADVSSLYARKILKESGTTAAAVSQEIKKWEKVNIDAIQKATDAVNAGTPETVAFGDLTEKLSADMQAAGGPVSKFKNTAEKMFPKLQQDLIEAQTKAKEMSLNIKDSADATKLSEVLPNNTVARSLAKPGGYMGLSRVRSAASSMFGGRSGLSKFGIPRFMISPNSDPASLAYKKATSQEHVSTTELQAQNLKTQAALRKQAKENALVAVGATAEGAGTASPSKKTIPIGEDIARGLEVGMQNRTDDVAKAGSNLTDSAVGGIKRGGKGRATRGQGAPTPLSTVAAGMPVTPDVISGVGKRGGRFAAMGRGLAGGRAGVIASSALMAGSMLPGQAGQIAGTAAQAAFGLQAVGMAAKFLPGPLKLVAVGLLASYGITKLINAARERERKAIEGLGDVMILTTDKLKTLGDFFGLVPQKLGYENLPKAGGASLGLNTQQRTQVDQLKASSDFKKQFGGDVTALKTASKEQAQLIFNALAVQLKGRGFAKENIQTIVDALREESGKTNVTLDFNKLTITTPEGLASLNADAETLAREFSNSFKSGMVKARVWSSNQGKAINTLVPTKEFRKEISTTSKAFTSFMGGLQGQFQAGLISSKQFQAGLSQVSAGILSVPQPQALMLTSYILKQMGVDPEVIAAGNNIKDLSTKMAVLTAVTLGAINPTKDFMNALAGKDGVGAQLNAARQLDAATQAALKAQEANNKAIIESTKAAAAAAAAGDKLSLVQILTKNIKELKNQITATNKLRAAGVEASMALQLASNAEIAALIAKGKLTKQQLALIKEYTQLTKDAAAQEAALSKTATESAIEEFNKKKAMYDLQEQLIKMQYSAEIDKQNQSIKEQERALELVNRKISSIQDGQVKTLQDTIDSNNYALEGITRQEDQVNAKYDEQETILSRIAAINQDIVAMQKARVSLADALSSGDISAAAQSIVELRAQQASSQSSTQQEALKAARDQEIKALGRVKLEKENKDLQYQILQIQRQQIKPLEDQKFIIEQNMETYQNAIDDMEYKIYSQIQSLGKELAKTLGYTKLQIENAVSALTLGKEAGIDNPNFLNNVIKAALGDAQSLAAVLASLPGLYSAAAAASATPSVSTDTSSGAGSGTTNKTSTPTATTGSAATTSATAAKPVISSISKVTTPQASSYYAYQAAKNVTAAKTAATSYMAYNAAKTVAASKIFAAPTSSYLNYRASGGIIPQYFASGGFSRGTDTVPSMLTPGEYVVRKSAVDNYGINNLNAINSGTNPESSVYNYSLSVNVDGSSMNANDIATTVIKRIKQLDSQRIRKQSV